MDVGRDPREGIFYLLGLIVNWLLAMSYKITANVFYTTIQN